MRRTGDSSVMRSPSGRRKRGMSEDPHTWSTVVKARIAIAGSDLDGIAPAERAEAERLGLGEHRRAEWRAGRLAARAALEGLLGAGAAAGLVVAREEDGAPVVVGADGVAVSISHGRRWAVAAAGRVARLGIDLCEV